MSVILDALKKLDREKSSRRGGAANIATEILRPDPASPGRSLRFYGAAVFLTAVATAAITYGTIVKFGLTPKSLPPAAVSPSAPGPQATPPPPGISAVSKSLPRAAVSPAAPVEQAAAPPPTGSVSKPLPPVAADLSAAGPQAAPPPPEVSPGAKSLPPAAVNPSEPSPQVVDPSSSREPAREAQPETGQVSPRTQAPAESQKVIPEKAGVASPKTTKPAGPAPDRSATGRPLLKITAIVWSEDPSRRFAVVNGVMAYEGTVVDGVKVDQINPTSLRFSDDGRPFEIPIHR